MRHAKTLLLSALLLVGLMGAASTAFADHWRNHDGRWSYYHDGDKRWYYTDGQNWFYEDGGAWKVYTFDKEFGRKDFEMGEYKRPGADVKIEVPHHRVFRP
jgi:hypothetical protein